MSQESNMYDFSDTTASWQFLGDVSVFIDDVVEQNHRFNLATELGDQDFTIIAQNGVAEEQVETIRHLTQMSGMFPYESLNDDIVKAEGTLAGLTQSFTEAQENVAKQHATIDGLVATTTRLSPKAVQNVALLAKQKKEAINTDEVEKLQDEIIKATQKRNEILGICAVAGQAWPIPLAVQGRANIPVLPEADPLVHVDEKALEQELKPELLDAELCELVASGDREAGIEFFKRYYKLIRYMVKRLQPETPSNTDPVYGFEDLSQDAWVYMIELAGKYDAKRDIPFASFATGYMLNVLKDKRDAGNNHGTHMPPNIMGMVRKMIAINGDRMTSRRRILSEEEIAKEFNVAVNSSPGRVAVSDLQRAVMLTRYLGSIDTGFSSQTDDSPGNTYIADERNSLEIVMGEPQPEIDAVIDETLLKDDVNALLSTLDEEEAEYLRLRFGIGSTSKTVSEVAAILGVSQSVVRSMDGKALLNLRKNRAIISSLHTHLWDYEPALPEDTFGFSHIQPIAQPTTVQDSYHNYAILAEEQLRHYNSTKLYRLVKKEPDSEVLESILKIFKVDGGVDLEPSIQNINLVQAIRPHLQKRYELSQHPKAPYAWTYESYTWEMGLQLLSKLETEWSWRDSVVQAIKS